MSAAALAPRWALRLLVVSVPLASVTPLAAATSREAAATSREAAATPREAATAPLEAAATPLAAPDLLVCAGPGASGIFDRHQDPWGFAEIRTAPRLWSFGLWAAVEAGPHDWWAGGGIVGELRFFERWRFSPGFGLGGYADDGHGLNLGTALEMRTQIELSRACGDSANGWRIALSLAHFSNAQIAGGANPGAEVLKLAVQIPLER